MTPTQALAVCKKMKTIETKIIPSSNTKPQRIKAYAPDGSTLTVTQGELENANIPATYSEEAHRYAARKLADKLNSGGNWGGNFVSGETLKGYAHIFLPNGATIKGLTR